MVQLSLASCMRQNSFQNVVRLWVPADKTGTAGMIQQRHALEARKHLCPALLTPDLQFRCHQIVPCSTWILGCPLT